jgi:hypothetical protein
MVQGLFWASVWGVYPTLGFTKDGANQEPVPFLLGPGDGLNEANFHH